MIRSLFGAVRLFALAAKFALELAVLAALAYWGSRTGDGVAVNVILAIAAPALAATVWGLFAAPRAPRRLATASRLVLELLVFGAAPSAG